MRYVFSLLSLLFVVDLATAQTAYQVEEYQVAFFIKNAGITVEGSLEGLEAEVEFHLRKPAKNRITASLDPSTIQTGIKIRDKHLKRADYFDIEQYPKITFESIGFSKTDKNELIGTFLLTIKGIEEEVEMPITYTNASDKLTLSGSFILNRLHFDLGDNSIILSDDVEVQLHAQLARLDS
jgi:polyisoprenoid-binding protein YceI